MKQRLRNYGLWIAVASLIVLGAQDAGFALPGNYDAIVNKILEILILLGIINNPTTTNPGYKDDISTQGQKISNVGWKNVL